MSKRVRKVAFADEVQVEDKRRREDDAEEGEDSGDEERKQRSECALIRTRKHYVIARLSPRIVALQVEALAGQ